MFLLKCRDFDIKSEINWTPPEIPKLKQNKSLKLKWRGKQYQEIKVKVGIW